MFRQQYSKIGNTREQLFTLGDHFILTKKTETIDTYVTCIRWVATLLDYEEPQILEVFKNTLPTRLYCVLFPIENLRQAVETVKRIFTKEKTYRQLARQSSSAQFMSVRYIYNKRVAFNMQDGLEDKIDKLTAMTGKLAARDSKVNRPFQPQVYQSKWRGQEETFMTHTTMAGGTIKINIDQIVVIGEFNLAGKAEVDQDMNKIIEKRNFRSNTRSYQNFRRQNSRGEYRRWLEGWKLQ